VLLQGLGFFFLEEVRSGDTTSLLGQVLAMIEDCILGLTRREAENKYMNFNPTFFYSAPPRSLQHHSTFIRNVLATAISCLAPWGQGRVAVDGTETSSFACLYGTT